MRKGLSFSEAGKLGGIKWREVSKEQKEERIKKYNENPKLCNYCQKPLTYKQRRYKCCSHSCSGFLYNGNLGNIKSGKYANKKCLNCDEITKNRKFCSHKCDKEYKRKLRWKEIEKTDSLIYYKKDKRYLIDKRGHKCEICGITEWLGKPILLILDHIDGNSDNNKLDNVRLICSNCDATLDTYKSKNRKSGRYYRRQRYANGQSY